jgi:hypothetical protein
LRIDYGKELILVAIPYGSWQRPALKELREHVTRLFVLDDVQKELAQELYPNAEVFAVGHPEWETFFFPRFTREQVRATLGENAKLDLSPEHKLILVAGEKEIGLNITLGVCVIEAIRMLPNPEDYRIIFTIHPGHDPLPGGADLREFYQHELGRYDERVKVTASCKADPFGIGTPDMVPGADIVIGTNSTVQIQAACLRIPAIGLFLRRAFRGQDLPEERGGWWEPANQGAIAAIYGPNADALAHLIEQFSLLKRYGQIRHLQTRAFPAVERIGAAYEKMCAALG